MRGQHFLQHQGGVGRLLGAGRQQQGREEKKALHARHAVHGDPFEQPPRHGPGAEQARSSAAHGPPGAGPRGQASAGTGRGAGPGWTGLCPEHLHLAGDLAAFLDGQAAAARDADDAAGGADHQRAARGQRAVEGAGDLGILDLDLAAEDAGLATDSSVAWIIWLSTVPSTTRRSASLTVPCRLMPRPTTSVRRSAVEGRAGGAGAGTRHAAHRGAHRARRDGGAGGRRRARRDGWAVGLGGWSERRHAQFGVTGGRNGAQARPGSVGRGRPCRGDG